MTLKLQRQLFSMRCALETCAVAEQSVGAGRARRPASVTVRRRSSGFREGQEVSGLTSWEPFFIPNELRAVGPTLSFAAAFCLVFAWLELAGVLAGRHLSGVRAMVVGPSPIKSLFKNLSGKPRALDRDQGEGQEQRPNIDSPSDGLRRC